MPYLIPQSLKGKDNTELEGKMEGKLRGKKKHSLYLKSLDCCWYLPKLAELPALGNELRLFFPNYIPTFQYIHHDVFSKAIFQI